MKKIFPLLIVFLFLFISCKEKKIDIKFSGEGRFSHNALVKLIDEPESFQDKSTQSEMQKLEQSGETENSDFYGITPEEMGEIIKSFGDCEGNGYAYFTVELNGFSLKKIYAKKDTNFFFKFSSENELHEKVFETAEKMKAENPDLKVFYTANHKSFSVQCNFTEDYVLFDSSNEENEIDFSNMDKSNSKNKFKVKLSGNKIIITGEDKKLGAYIQFVIEQLKDKK